MLLYIRDLLCSKDDYKAEGDIKMKKGIHPNYKKVKVVCTSCGNEFESGSDGRVDKFNKKYGFK